MKIYQNPAFKKHSGPFAGSFIVSFYNQVGLFDLMLQAVLRQSHSNFEWIISDDGSSPEVVQHIQGRLETLDFPTQHFWQEDLGFRKNRMLNWSIHSAASDYLIFSDQDCLPHREFIREHIDNRKPHSVLCGRRMELTPQISKLVTPERVGQGWLETNLWWLIPASSWMKDNNGVKGIYLKEGWLRRSLNKKPRGIVGCNFSIAKVDMLSINGFDTRYEGPGTGEDTDIDFRLQLAGVSLIPFLHAGVQYHIHHPLTRKPSTCEDIFAEVVKSRLVKTPFGLSQQLQQGEAQ